MKHSSSLRRHGTREVRPGEVIGLSPAHPALQGLGRTLFPSTVVGTHAAPRLLVSGHNNPKLGREVQKGDRKGWPIFHVTLEERATCPRTCEQWAPCFGNAMPQARRHRVDSWFLPLLRVEVGALAEAHPNGFLVRLHALGDFYSVDYVLAWAELLAKHPALHVFGYTARRVDDPDRESARIAAALRVLTDGMWSRFAIRTSASDPVARSRAVVVTEDPGDDDTIVCPAQTGATEACATCGLCWSDNARDKTIAFLLHGMVRARTARSAPEADVVERRIEPPAPVAAPSKTTKPRPTNFPNRSAEFAKQRRSQDEQILAALRTSADAEGIAAVSLGALAKATTVPHGSVHFVIHRLAEAGQIEILKGETRAEANRYRIIDATVGAEKTPSAQDLVPLQSVAVPPRIATAHPAKPPVDRLMDVLRGAADINGAVTGTVRDFCAAAGIRPSEWDAAKGLLIRRGALRLVEAGKGDGDVWVLQVLAPGAEPATAAPVVARKPAPRHVTEADFVLPAQTAADGEAVTLLNMPNNGCRYPLGQPDPVQRYCGRPAKGEKAYCAKHLRAMYVGGARA